MQLSQCIRKSERVLQPQEDTGFGVETMVEKQRERLKLSGISGEKRAGFFFFFKYRSETLKTLVVPNHRASQAFLPVSQAALC